MTHHILLFRILHLGDSARRVSGGSVSLSLLDPPYIMANPLAVNIFPFTLQNVEEFGNEKHSTLFLRASIIQYTPSLLILQG